MKNEDIQVSDDRNYGEMKCIREMDRKCENWPTLEEMQLAKLYENNARILLR